MTTHGFRVRVNLGHGFLDNVDVLLGDGGKPLQSYRCQYWGRLEMCRYEITYTVEKTELDAVRTSFWSSRAADQVDGRRIVDGAQSQKSLEDVGSYDLAEDGTVDLWVVP